MNIHNILVAFNGSDGSVSALRYAARLAARSGGAVTAVLAHSAQNDYADQSRWMSSETLAVLQRAGEAVLEGIEARFHAVKDDLGLPDDRIDFRRLGGRVDSVLAETARRFDIIAIGRFSMQTADRHVSVHPDRVAMISGRPVLIVPPGYDADGRHQRVVVAWDNSRAAAGALWDSVHLMGRGSDVTLATVGDVVPRDTIDELTGHLAAHGVTASHAALPRKGSVGRTLLDFCAESSAQLLIMGAYEHSKFEQDLFGGVTAEVLKQAELPVLLSH